MFDILVSLCVSATLNCVDRLLPAGFADRSACVIAAHDRVMEWLEPRPGLEVEAHRCVSLPDLEPLSVTEVADGVFVHQGRHAVPDPNNAGDLANIGFIVGEDAVAVVDAGGSRHVGEGLYAAIRAETTLPIRWLILTHMHPDHVLGAEVFREAGAQIVGHERLAASLANRAQSYETAMRRLMGPSFVGTRVVGPDSVVSAEIDLGGRVLAVTQRRVAHTDNDVTVLDVRTGTAFVGDLVFSGHTPALDGSLVGWLSVLEDMRGEGIQRIVPGHGPAVLDWPAGGAPLQDYLETLAAGVRRALAAGEPLSSAINHVAQESRGSWLLFDEFHKRNVAAAFKELEWE